ncbi:hypothetical protein GCM10023170_049700 [Phytohabitans houttuyneae]|uniref:Uncharacterized protein n=1 Tax=Phytohabitans houttuyneae TaxID=1076126 RepID=A0A6V8KIL5_9ACTN|nr:hypothetical protein Phou_092330 [Phytohabitans houttuyneae]
MDEADRLEALEQLQGGQDGTLIVQVAVPLPLDTEDPTFCHADLPLVDGPVEANRPTIGTEQPIIRPLLPDTMSG